MSAPKCMEDDSGGDCEYPDYCDFGRGLCFEGLYRSGVEEGAAKAEPVLMTQAYAKGYVNALDVAGALFKDFQAGRISESDFEPTMKRLAAEYEKLCNPSA